MRKSLALLFFGVTAGLWAQGADQLYSNGRQAFADSLWPMAKSQFSQLLHRYPEDDRADTARYMGGVAAYYAGNYASCIDMLKDFSRLHPHSVWNRRVAYWEGMAQLELKRWAQAAVAFERQVKMTEEPIYRERSLFYMGVCRESLGEWNEAEAVYNAVLKDGRDYETIARSVFRLGQIKLSSGRAEEALNHFVQLAYEYTTASVAEHTQYWMAECYRSMGSDRKALDEYRSYLTSEYESPHRSNALLEAARLALKFGDGSEAIAYLDLRDRERGKNKDAYDETALRIQGMAYLQQGQVNEARSVFTNILKNSQDDVENQVAAFNLAQTWIGTESPLKSIPYLVESAQGPDPRISADALYLSGTIRLHSGQNTGVADLHLFANRFASDDRREEALRIAAKSLQASGDLDQAVTDLDILIRDYPQSPEIASYLFLRGEIHLDSGRQTAALADFAQLVANHEHSALVMEAHSRIGFIYAEREQYVRASNHYMEVVKMVGSIQENEVAQRALYSAGVAYLNSGSYASAIETFEKLMMEAPDSPWTAKSALHLGDSRYATGDYAGAREAYGIVTQYGIDSFEVHYGIGWAWFMEAQWSKSETAFKKAASEALDDESWARSMYRVGLSQMSEGRWEDAVVSYRDALSVGRQAWREEALYQLAWSLLHLKQQEASMESIALLATEFPHSALIADLPFRMGENALSAGAFRTAVEWFDRTVEQYPDTEQGKRAILRAAYALHKAGDTAAAVQRYMTWVYENLEDSGVMSTIQAWADVLIEAGDPELAQRSAQGIIEKVGDRTNLSAPIILAQIRVSGNPLKSRDALELLVQDMSLSSSDRAEALLLRAHRYRMDGEYSRSRHIYEVLVEEIRGRIGVEAQDGLARSHMEEGNIDQAAEAFQAISYMFPEYTNFVNQALREAEKLYREAGRYDEADKVRAQQNN